MDQRKRISLTQYSTKAGWASKFAPGDLEQALEGLAPESLGGFVGGMKTRGDAGYAPFGGPRVAVPEGRARDLVRLLHGGGVFAAVVGKVVDGAGVRVKA
jgi:hypothetical protein